MSMQKSSHGCLLVVLSVVALSCGVDDPNRQMSPEEAADIVNRHVSSHVEGLTAALEPFNDGLFWDLAKALDGQPCENEVSGFGLDAALQDALEIVQRDVVASNGIEHSGTEVDFPLSAQSMCSDDDSACAEELALNPVVLRVSSEVDDEVFVNVLMGVDQHRVMSFHLTATAVESTLYLSAWKNYLAGYVNNDEDDVPVTVPTTARGEIVFRVEKTSETLYSAVTRIPEGIDVVIPGDDDELEAATEFHFAVADPALQSTIDSSSDVWEAVASFNEIKLVVPADDCDPDFETCPTEPDPPVVLTFPSFSGTFRYSDMIEFVDVSLGDDTTTATQDDATVFSMDINPDDEGKFSGNIAYADAGVMLTIEPKLDASVALKFSELLDEDAPEYMHDQLFDLSFGAAPAGKILLRADPDCLSIDSEGQFELVDGPFSLHETHVSDSAENTFSIDEGMCLSQLDENPDERFLGTMFDQQACQ
jgi:hypothetical protein